MKRIILGIFLVVLISIILFVGFIIYFASNFSAGTLGGFDSRTFPTSKRVLVKGIDSIYSQYPQYKIPEKWDSLNDWSQRGYDFLDTRIFYFSSNPEEMYYVSFYGDANDTIQKDTTRTSLSIRAVHDGKNGWNLEDEFSNKEKNRIENRFDQEIISKLEKFSGVKAEREK
jgi:hypothetical protein